MMAKKNITVDSLDYVLLVMVKAIKLKSEIYRYRFLYGISKQQTPVFVGNIFHVLLAFAARLTGVTESISIALKAKKMQKFFNLFLFPLLPPMTGHFK